MDTPSPISAERSLPAPPNTAAASISGQRKHTILSRTAAWLMPGWGPQAGLLRRRVWSPLRVMALSVVLGVPVAAQASDALVGALLGAGAGALIGQAMGGRDGAVVGGAFGAVAGAASAGAAYAPSSYHGGPVVVHSPAVVYAPAPYPVYGVAAPVYAPPPVYSTYPAYGYAHRPPVVVVRRAPVIVYEHGYRHRGHGHRHFHDGGHPGRRY